MGGSEYFEYIHKFVGGNCPAVDFTQKKKNMETILDVISNDIVKNVHDCSKGGLAIAAAELSITNKIGCNISLDKIPGEKIDVDRILFSESHSRYLLVVEKKNLKKLEKSLKVSYGIIGTFGGDSIVFSNKKEPIINISVNKAEKTWLNSLSDLVLHS